MSFDVYWWVKDGSLNEAGAETVTSLTDALILFGKKVDEGYGVCLETSE